MFREVKTPGKETILRSYSLVSVMIMIMIMDIVREMRQLLMIDMCSVADPLPFLANKFVMQFLTRFKHLVTLKIHDQKIILAKMYFGQYYMSRIVYLQGSVCGLRIQTRF